VTKLNPSGSALVYSTYLGAGDEGFSIALNASGEAYVIGISGSPDFPTTAGAFDTSFNGGDYDAFVTSSIHLVLPWCTLLSWEEARLMMDSALH